MNVRKVFCLVNVALIAISFQACSKDARISVGRSISVRVDTESTRSAVITTKTLEEAGEFVMDAWLDADYYTDSNDPSGTTVDIPHHVNSGGTANVNYISDEWQLKNGECWVADLNTRFWCHAPASVNGTLSIDDPYNPHRTGEAKTVDHGADDDAETTVGKIVKQDFSYTMPAGGQTDGSGNHIDADNSDDIIFAYARQRYNGTNDYVNLHFYHAMSEIIFCVSTDDGTFDKTLELTSIKLENIYTKGNCSFNGPETHVSGTDPEDYFTWTGISTPGVYTQTYNASFYPDVPEEEDGWVEGKYNKGTAGSPDWKKLYSTTNNFFFIPQDNRATGKGAVVMTATFNDNGTSVQRTVTLTDLWKPGYYYKYKIKATTIGRYITLSVSLVEWKNFDDKMIVY